MVPLVYDYREEVARKRAYVRELIAAATQEYELAIKVATDKFIEAIAAARRMEEVATNIHRLCSRGATEPYCGSEHNDKTT